MWELFIQNTTACHPVTNLILQIFLPYNTPDLQYYSIFWGFYRGSVEWFYDKHMSDLTNNVTIVTDPCSKKQ